MKKLLFTALAVSILLASCYYNKEEELYPNSGACEVINVRYSDVITPILEKYSCSFCHGSIAPSGNISLSTYADVKAQVANGKLLGAITHSPGFSPMPKGGNKMSTCDINKIKAWIDAGAPEN